MPDITSVVRPPSAAQILTDSVNFAWRLGLFVSTARDLGVVCSSSAEPSWVVDPRGGRAISVLGAVLLAQKPRIADVDAALSGVFETRPEFHEGIEDATAGERDIRRDDRLYAEGAFLGAQMRELIQRRLGVPVERETD